MSKNNKPAPPPSPKQGQDGHRPKRHIGGYQPRVSESSPVKPPSNPPKMGRSSGKK